jgi:AcrR family transcriptional regulator
MTKPARPAVKPPNAYHHGDLRQALIQAALASVEHEGPGGISLASTAKALGVSQPAPYRHFADRDALLAAVAAEGFRIFKAALANALAASADGSGLSRMSHAYVRFGLARPGLYRLMFASHLLSHDSEGGELTAAAMESFNLLMASLGPDIDANRRRVRATGIWVGLHGVVMLTSFGLLADYRSEDRIAQLVEDIIAR